MVKFWATCLKRFQDNFPLRKIAPHPDNLPQINAPQMIATPDDCSQDNCSRGKLPSRKIAHRTIAIEENCPPGNCPRGKLTIEKLPLTMKFSSKIIAPTQANFTPKEYYKRAEENYPLCTNTVIYQYCNLGVKGDLLPYNFYRF